MEVNDVEDVEAFRDRVSGVDDQDRDTIGPELLDRAWSRSASQPSPDVPAPGSRGPLGRRRHHCSRRAHRRDDGGEPAARGLLPLCPPGLPGLERRSGTARIHLDGVPVRQRAGTRDGPRAGDRPHQPPARRPGGSTGTGDHAAGARLRRAAGVVGWQFMEFTANQVSAAMRYPLWLRNAALLAGALIALHAGRAGAAADALAAAAAAGRTRMGEIGTVLVVGLFALLLLGVPIAVTLGLLAALGISLADLNPLILAQRVIAGSTVNSLLAIPGLILAGELMSAGGLSRRLVRVASAL
ncbi:MAG: TRAP transporter large permease subunit [Arhodomonas sp.]|nr:TRAP transporter large permease subunit [Arhodomonas sp.]